MRRNLKLVLTLLGILALAGLFLSLTRRAENAFAKAPTEPAVQKSERARPRWQPNSAAPPQEPNPDDPNLPVIDEVTVNKTGVCRGEENFINVKASTRNGTDAFLATRLLDPAIGHLVLGGNRIPFRLDRPLERPMTLTVEGNMVSKSVELPMVNVKDCDAPRQVTIHVTRKLDARDRMNFTAELVERQAAKDEDPLEPSTYEWDFGDGGTETTTSAQVQHSYEGRSQSVRQSSFVVSVTIADKRGQRTRGSTVVAFPNGAFGPLRFKDQVVISVGVAEAAPGSDAPEKIWLYHGYHEPVRLESATLVEEITEDRGVRETLRRSYAPNVLLGLVELAPQRSSTIRDLTEYQPTNPTARRYVELQGRSNDGKLATGGFTLLSPNPPAEPAVVAEGT